MWTIFAFILVALIAVAVLISLVLGAGVGLIMLLWKPLLVIIGVILFCKWLKTRKS